MFASSICSSHKAKVTQWFNMHAEHLDTCNLKSHLSLHRLCFGWKNWLHSAGMTLKPQNSTRGCWWVLSPTYFLMSYYGVNSVGKRGLFMCRIASLLVTEAERKHVRRCARFQEHWDRGVIKIFFLQGNVLKEIHAILTETLGEHAPSYATVKNWVAV
jgi:hypothetical protein